jgi:hypothetical protein
MSISLHENPDDSDDQRPFLKVKNEQTKQIFQILTEKMIIDRILAFA